MLDPLIAGGIAVALLAALSFTLFAALAGWRGWLALQRLRLEHGRGGGKAGDSPGRLIDIVDLKERIRRLEAIAAAIDP
ncbi:MAG: hypothetical protein ACFBQW_08885 [Sphingomonadaceae bacterium]